MATLLMTTASAEDTRALSGREVAAAIEVAVRTSLGADSVTAVVVDAVEWQAVRAGAVALEAVPAPGARLAHRLPFILVDRRGRSRIGWASARIEVEAQYLQAGAPIRRGDALDSATVVRVSGRLPAMALARLDVQLQGGVARRDIRQGEILTARLVEPAAAVRRAEPVTVFASAGMARVALSAVASESGTIGQVIRVVNPETRRELRARVTGKGQAEVLR